MATNKQLSSRSNLNAYLYKNIDAERRWEDEDIKDYSILENAYAQGKINGDTLAEGRTYLSQYLADSQANDTYNQAVASADNSARQQTAYQRYLASRMASYLGEVQGNAGIKGYNGVVEGQAVALHNNEANAQRQIAQEQAQAKQSALGNYMGAISNNSETAIGELTAIDAAREEKRTNLYNSAINSIDTFAGVEDSISLERDKQLRSYIDSLELDDKSKQNLKDYYDRTYGQMIQATTNADGTKTSASSANEIASLKSEIDAGLTGKSYDQIKTYKQSLEKSKGNMSDEEYKSYMTKLNNYAQKVPTNKATVSSLEKTGAAGSSGVDFKITIGGTEYDARIPYNDTVDKDTISELNKICGATNKKEVSKDTLVMYNGKLYVKGGWDNWHHVTIKNGKVEEVYSKINS